jgi:glycosyltransferase involved in cell wall biosynthesis
MDWCDWWGRGGTQAERPGKWAKLLYVPIETYFEEAFRTRADGTTVISKALHDRAIALGVPARSIRILPQGCDVEAPPFTDRVAARKHLGLPATHPVIVSVGAMTTSEAKLLADTLRLLFRRRPDCSFFLIGGHRYHFPEEVLKARQFTQTGFVPDAVLRNYMSACDALLAPISDTIASRARWPSKVNPFLAAGRATIITRVGDLACLLEREQAALVARDQPEEIVDGLIRLLDDPGLRQHYEVQARRVAEGLLRWDLLAANVEDLYHIVRGEKSQGCTSSNRQDRQTHRNAVTRTGIRHQGVRKYVPVTFPA